MTIPQARKELAAIEPGWTLAQRVHIRGLPFPRWEAWALVEASGEAEYGVGEKRAAALDDLVRKVRERGKRG